MLIASASTTVQFHEFPTGNISINHEPNTNEPIRSISWSKDGNWLCVVPDTGIAEIISIKSNNIKIIHHIPKVEETTFAAFQNSTKKYVVMGTSNGQVLVYDIKNKNIKKQFNRLTSPVTHVDFTANDTHIIASCEDGNILLFSNVTNNLSCTLTVPKSNSCSTLRTNPLKRNYFIAGSNEGIVAVWDINVNKCKFSTLAHNAPVTAVSFSPTNCDLILSAAMDRQFSFYDIVSKKCVAKVPVESNVTSVDFAPDGKSFVLGSRNGNLNVYDSRNISQPLQIYEGHDSSVVQLLFQKAGEDDCNLSNSLPIEVTEENNSQNHLEISETNESIGVLVQMLPNHVAGDSIDVHSKGSDSFLSAIGIHNTTEASKNLINPTITINESFNNNVIEKKIIDTPSGNVLTTLQERFPLQNAGSLCSTPIALSEQFNFKASPIIVGGKSVIKVDNNTVLEEVTKTVKNEMQEIVEELKTDFSKKLFLQSNQMRKDCLGIHMAVIKGFMNTENDMNTLKDYLSNETTEQLLAENAFLRNKVIELEQALALREN